MFFPATDPKKRRKHTSSQNPRTKFGTTPRLPSLPKI